MTKTCQLLKYMKQIFFPIFYISVLIICFGTSCYQSENKSTDEIVARVQNEVFTIADLQLLMPKNIYGEDSVFMARRIKEDWVRRQLLYNLALLNVKDVDGSLAKQIKQYTQDLYIHRYEQMFVSQRLDTLIPNSQIQKYYKSQQKNFILKQHAVRPLFIVFNKETDITRARQWFLSRRNDDMDNLKDFSYQFSPHFYFADTWFYVSNFQHYLPVENQSDSRLLSGSSLIFQDSAHYYFVRVEESLSPGNITPVDLLSDEIAKILLHKRRQNVINSMRNKIYNDALNKQEFEIF